MASAYIYPKKKIYERFGIKQTKEYGEVLVMARCTVGAYLTIKLIYVNQPWPKLGHFQMEIEMKL